MRDPGQGQGPGRPGGPPSPNPGRTRFPGWIIWVVLLTFVAYYGYVFLWPHTGTRLAISYTAFTQQVEADNVKEVTIRGQEVTGTFATKVRVVDDRVLGPTEAPPPGVSESDVRSGTLFQTTIPENTQPTVVDLLERHNVTIHAAQSGGSLLPNLLISVLPLVFIIGFVLLLGRNMTRGQQNVFSFGRSKARVYDAERPRVTFSDVAGEEEAKAELSEVVDFLRNPVKYHSIGARLPRGILLI
ncbi:MAG: ATP-dependent metallopeptidase FtsH/Yme1/Tma family protein, partial [Thermomicrobiaceae bacterium]|nr:ATP-dependent metallopeptidase FtsH/Yme1/Tma family protein [Thermomicrobiaceae bacterium]